MRADNFNLKNSISDEVFKVGDVVTWADYVHPSISRNEWIENYGVGPFRVIAVKPHNDPEAGGHTQLITLHIDTYHTFSGLWLTKKVEHAFIPINVRVWKHQRRIR